MDPVLGSEFVSGRRAGAKGDLDRGIHMDPVLGAKFISSRRAGAEGVALGRGSLGTQGVQIAEGEGISSTKPSSMVKASGRNKKVISQAPRHSTQGLNTTDPRVEQEGNHHHAQWAALWDTTGVVVSNPEPPPQSYCGSGR